MNSFEMIHMPTLKNNEILAAKLKIYEEGNQKTYCVLFIVVTNLIAISIFFRKVWE